MSTVGTGSSPGWSGANGRTVTATGKCVARRSASVSGIVYKVLRMWRGVAVPWSTAWYWVPAAGGTTFWNERNGRVAYSAWWASRVAESERPRVSAGVATLRETDPAAKPPLA